jgi:nitrite reductase (cytochrome c-552)
VTAVKVSDHWVRSPLDNVNQACQTCHKQDEQALKDRIVIIQNNTAQLLRTTEAALERRSTRWRGQAGRADG